MIDPQFSDIRAARPAEPEPAEFYILDLTSTADLMVFWAANNLGFTTRIDRAGRYTAAQIEDDPDYLDNGHSTKAIPCELADAAVARVIPRDSATLMAWGAVYEPRVKPWPYWPEATGRSES